MGNYAYHKLDFINGVKVKELRSKSVNLSDDTKSGTTTFDDRPSWLSAFWDCLKLYILSVPKWDSKENEWKCSCFCSDGSSPKKLEDPLSPGGGSIFPPTFFIPPTNLIPPRVWDPFPINPGGVGPGGSGSGGSNHIHEIIRQINNKVPLSFSDEQYLLTNLTAANELIEIIKHDEEKEELAISVRLALSVLKNNSFNTEDILREYNVYHNQNYIESDPITVAIIRYFALKYATLKAENFNLPENQKKTDLKLLYLTFSDAIHIGLDLLGYIPIGGEVFDVINGFTYHLEGDKTNAYLSYASAIPLAGYAAAGVKAIKAGSVIIAVVGKKGFLVAGRVTPKAFRDACGAVGTQVGHHIIPFHEIVQSHPLMQMAFRAGFDPNNAAINGKAIEAVRNSGNHTSYANKIVTRFEKSLKNPPIGGWNPKSAKAEVENIIKEIKIAIDSQGGVHVDYLNF